MPEIAYLDHEDKLREEEVKSLNYEGDHWRFTIDGEVLLIPRDRVMHVKHEVPDDGERDSNSGSGVSYL